MTAAKRMLPLLGVRKTMPIDSDKDKTPDIIDCRPHDKSRQDITVTVGGEETKTSKWWKKKKQQMAERRAEKRKYREAERVERRKAEHEERMKYAKEREKIKTETALKAYRRRRESGGIVGQFVSGFQKPSRRVVTRKGKKGRRDVTPSAPRESLSSYMEKKFKGI